MALYQNYTFTTANQYVQDIAAFALANGWTLDFNGVYLTSYWRCHFHKGDAHFEMRSYSATGVYLSSCTGYTAGTTPALQPGYSGAERVIPNNAGNTYWLVSVVGAIYFTWSYTTTVSWGAVFNVQDKIGAWSNGWGFLVPSSVIFATNCYLTAGGFGVIYYNGGWSASVAAGGLLGTNAVNSDLAMENQPMFCNGGLMPLPVLLLLGNATDSTKLHPLGFAPGIYKTSSGDIYNLAEELIIGGDTYLLMPDSGITVGLINGDILFKLGA